MRAMSGGSAVGSPESRKAAAADCAQRPRGLRPMTRPVPTGRPCSTADGSTPARMSALPLAVLLGLLAATLVAGPAPASTGLRGGAAVRSGANGSRVTHAAVTLAAVALGGLRRQRSLASADVTPCSWERHAGLFMSDFAKHPGQVHHAVFPTLAEAQADCIAIGAGCRGGVAPTLTLKPRAWPGPGSGGAVMSMFLSHADF